ncbi:hypothetical protein NMG60_11004952 [Bertholletia excelsa]
MPPPSPPNSCIHLVNHLSAKMIQQVKATERHLTVPVAIIICGQITCGIHEVYLFLFGVILIFYIDSIAEERLHMVFSSLGHLMVARECIIIMKIVYKMDFSLLGFLMCYWALRIHK